MSMFGDSRLDNAYDTLIELSEEISLSEFFKLLSYVMEYTEWKQINET